MSIKVYTGFGFTGTSIEDTLILLGKQTPAVQALVDAKSTGFLARRCAGLMDDYCEARAGDKPLSAELSEAMKQSAYQVASHAVAQEQRLCRASMERNPGLDCDVVVHLFCDPGTQTLLGTVGEERVGALAHLRSVPGITEFSYWNNVDADDQVSEEDWTQRGVLWNGALDAGFSFKMTWEPGYSTSQQVAEALPTWTERLNQRADNFVTNQYVEEVGGLEPANLSRIWQVLRDARGAMQILGSPWAERLQARKDALANILFPELSSLLTTKLVELPTN